MFYPKMKTMRNSIGDVEAIFDTLDDLSKWMFGDSTGSNAQLLSLQDTADSYILRYWMPAAQKDSISCNRKGEALEIRWIVDKKHVDELGYKYPVVNHGNWKLCLKIPEDVSDDPKLKYIDGVLSITFMKGKTTAIKQIQIE